jgi:hypothetical protein
MYKPSKIKAPSGKNKKKNGDPAYASNNTAAGQPAFAETTASGPESSRTYAAPDAATSDKSESQTPDRPAEETRKPVVNEDEQKKVVNQSSSSSAAAYDDSEES